MKKDLIGHKFGRLLVIEDSGERTKCGGVKYRCLCDCGNTSITARSELISGRATSCGCYRIERIRESRERLKGHPCNPNRKYDTNEERYQHYVYRQIRGRAKADCLDFELTYEQVKELTQSNCYYCNGEKSNVFKVKRFSEDYEYKYNGIDRVDSQRGYVEGNVVSCCKWCNQAKSTMSLQEFFLWSQRLSLNFTENKIKTV